MTLSTKINVNEVNTIERSEPRQVVGKLDEEARTKDVAMRKEPLQPKPGRKPGRV